MNWKSLYQEKLVSADEAVGHVKSGDRVVVPNAAGETRVLTAALVRHAERYENVEIIHMISLSPLPYCAPEMEKHFRHISLYACPHSRDAIAEGRADYIPVYFSNIPQQVRSMHPDVAFIHVSSPDEHGYCSYGVSADYSVAAGECAKLVIALVNPNMPRTFGSFIHVSQIDYIVETDIAVSELQPPHIGDVERGIGENVAKLIEDGDCLQMGIGAIPDAVLTFLTGKKDLGMHTEMFSDGAIPLMEAGIINNSKKTLHTGKTVATFLMGTRKLYDFVHNNPSVEMYPVNYVNDPRVIAQNDNLVSVNSCIQVDLMGQVVSTSLGLKQITGIGGQVDFVRGANWSKGGRTIMAMPSTAGGGKISKVVPLITEGAAVSTNRYDLDYVITEYGIAQLKGKTLRDRARALIEIAHPNFKDSLAEEFERRFKTSY